MDNRRLFLLAALGLVGYLIFNAWVADYGASPAHRESGRVTQQAASQGQSAHASSPSLDIPEPASTATTGSKEAATSATAGNTTAPEAPPLAHGKDIVAKTNVLRITLDTRGGGIRKAILRNYRRTVDSPEPVKLLKPDPANRLILQTGLRGLTPSNVPPTFKSAKRRYSLKPNQDTLKVPLVWRHAGITVKKVYTFKRDRYAVSVDWHITNEGNAALEVAPYAQFLQHYAPRSKGFFISRYMYNGPAVFNGDDYKKLSYEDLDDDAYSATASGGWGAVVNQYFVAAVIPPGKDAVHYFAQHLNDAHYRIGLVAPALTVRPGGEANTSQQLFLGPKLQDRLGQVAPGLSRVVDYGKLTIIAQPMFTILEAIHWVIGNWGWSIILLVFLIKIIFFPLNQKAGRSMAKMREFQPRIKAIQERYKDDKSRQSQAMMDLYKKEKINPMGGCLPMLLQIPIYFGLYYVLIYSVELRQAPFIFWLDNLSTPDPLYVLPILYGIAQFIQMRMQPQQSKMQERIMMVMPLGMVVFAAFMPVGLVLYWLSNAILTSAQQWHINRVIHNAKPGQKTKPKPKH